MLRLLARGYSNGEVAALLHIGEGTVKNHVARILDKLASAIGSRRSCERTRRASWLRARTARGATQIYLERDAVGSGHRSASRGLNPGRV